MSPPVVAALPTLSRAKAKHFFSKSNNRLLDTPGAREERRWRHSGHSIRPMSYATRVFSGLRNALGTKTEGNDMLCCDGRLREADLLLRDLQGTFPKLEAAVAENERLWASVGHNVRATADVFSTLHSTADVQSRVALRALAAAGDVVFRGDISHEGTNMEYTAAHDQLRSFTHSLQELRSFLATCVSLWRARLHYAAKLDKMSRKNDGYTPGGATSDDPDGERRVRNEQKLSEAIRDSDVMMHRLRDEMRRAIARKQDVVNAIVASFVRVQTALLHPLVMAPVTAAFAEAGIQLHQQENHTSSLEVQPSYPLEDAEGSSWSGPSVAVDDLRFDNSAVQMPRPSPPPPSFTSPPVENTWTEKEANGLQLPVQSLPEMSQESSLQPIVDMEKEVARNGRESRMSSGCVEGDHSTEVRRYSTSRHITASRNTVHFPTLRRSRTVRGDPSSSGPRTRNTNESSTTKKHMSRKDNVSKDSDEIVESAPDHKRQLYPRPC